MVGRLGLLLLALSVVFGGCAAANEERVARLESAVANLQERETPVTSLQDLEARVASLEEVLKEGSRPNGQRVQSVSERQPAVERRAPPSALSKAGGGLALQAAQEYQRALATLEAGKPQTAASMFTDFLRTHPGHKLAPNAAYWLGECYYSQRQYDKAIIAFKDVVALYPAHEKVAAALLKAAYSHSALGDTASAKLYLQTVLHEFPLSAPAALARARLVTM